MTNYVILDTSIYRELGLRFFENIDYINLCKFTEGIGSEVLISPIVFAEFQNHYETLLRKKTLELSNSFASLKRDVFFDLNFNEPSLIMNFENAIKSFQEKFLKNPNSKFGKLRMVQNTYIDSLALTNFILECRNAGIERLQVRDYLIWQSIILKAQDAKENGFKRIYRKKGEPKTEIYFIAKDGIFKSQMFQDELLKNGIDNVFVFDSIPQLLHRKGFNLPFFNAELILSKITTTRIFKDFSTDLQCFLSYISPKFDDINIEAKVQVAEILSREVIEYYSYLDNNDNKYKYITHLKVNVIVVYDKDIKYKGGYSYVDYLSYLETFDSHGRPYFNAPVLFIYEGLLDKEKETIKSVRFIDFMPDAFLHEVRK